ncbi:hypothetical protein Tco_0091284 [Tanacetum coccineum]
MKLSPRRLKCATSIDVFTLKTITYSAKTGRPKRTVKAEALMALEKRSRIIGGASLSGESHGALDLGSTRHCSRYCSKVLLLFESTAHYAQSTARCESTAVMFEGTASFIREGKIIMARIWRFIEEVIMKKIEYCLFDVVVEFHRHCSRYCSKVLLLFESTAHYAQSTARCESTAVMFEGTASFIREGKIIMARIWRFIEEVIMKKIEYCLFDVVVEFHREMITSQLQGKLRLYDEVRARTLFVLSSSNRGRLLGIIDLMRQKNKRMKQEGLNRQIGKLQDVT